VELSLSGTFVLCNFFSQSECLCNGSKRFLAEVAITFYCPAKASVDAFSLSVSAILSLPLSSCHFKSLTCSLFLVFLFTYLQNLFGFDLQSRDILSCSCCTSLTVSCLTLLRTILYSSNTLSFLVVIQRFQTLWTYIFFIFILWSGTHSLRMPTLRPASQAGPMRNPRERTSGVARHHQANLTVCVVCSCCATSPFREVCKAKGGIKSGETLYHDIYPAWPITTVSLAANTYCTTDGHSSSSPRTVGPRV